jgi:hypothetical protein
MSEFVVVQLGFWYDTKSQVISPKFCAPEE